MSQDQCISQTRISLRWLNNIDGSKDLQSLIHWLVYDNVSAEYTIKTYDYSRPIHRFITFFHDAETGAQSLIAEAVFVYFKNAYHAGFPPNGSTSLLFQLMHEVQDKLPEASKQNLFEIFECIMQGKHIGQSILAGALMVEIAPAKAHKILIEIEKQMAPKKPNKPWLNATSASQLSSTPISYRSCVYCYLFRSFYFSNRKHWLDQRGTFSNWLLDFKGRKRELKYALTCTFRDNKNLDAEKKALKRLYMWWSDRRDFHELADLLKQIIADPNFPQSDKMEDIFNNDAVGTLANLEPSSSVLTHKSPFYSPQKRPQIHVGT